MLRLSDEEPSTGDITVQFSAFFAGFAPWREIPGRPIESRKGAKLAKVRRPVHSKTVG